ncbi:MAG TPA: transglutaminase domain-containing protein [Pirellulaceae bacterium]|nr:transglutaminase domain-containing protein [Pirellulaceae bacterium]
MTEHTINSNQVRRSRVLASYMFRWRTLAGIASASAVLLLGLWHWRDEAHVRVFLLNSFTLAYQIYDPATPTGTVPTGPLETIGGQDAGARRDTDSLPPTYPAGILWQDETVALTLETPSPNIGQCLGPMPAGSVKYPAHIYFAPENLASHSLDIFRKRSHEVVASAHDEFSLSNRLRGLTSHGFNAADQRYSYPDQFLDIAMDGKPLNCLHFATTYVELAALKGYTARVLGLSPTGGVFAHAVAEIYSPHLGKWIVVDPDFNIAYRRHNIWLSAAELHDAWEELERQVNQQLNSDSERNRSQHLSAIKSDIPRRTEIEVVPLGAAGEELRSTNLAEGSYTGIGLEWYSHIYYACRNDYLTGYYPYAHPTRIRQYALRGTGDADINRVSPEAADMRDRSETYWPVGRTEVADAVVSRSDASHLTIDLHLTTYTPNFSHFQFSLDRGEWQTFATSHYTWKSDCEAHQLQLRSVNAANLCGEITTIRVVANN